MSESWKVRNRRWHANAGMFLAITLGLIALSCPFIAHKGGGGVGDALKMIHYGEFLPKSYRWIWIDLQGLGLGFLVVSGWLMHRKAVKRPTDAAGEDPRAAGSTVTFVPLGASTSCQSAMESARKAGIRCHECAAADFAGLKLPQERRLVFTGGEAVNVDSVAPVLASLATVRKPVLKRLEYSIDPSLDPALAEALDAALKATGARPFVELPPAKAGGNPVPLFTATPAMT